MYYRPQCYTDHFSAMQALPHESGHCWLCPGYFNFSTSCGMLTGLATANRVLRTVISCIGQIGRKSIYTHVWYLAYLCRTYRVNKFCCNQFIFVHLFWRCSMFRTTLITFYINHYLARQSLKKNTCYIIFHKLIFKYTLLHISCK